MSEVQKGCLEVKHNFPDKEMLLMRVAEEANLRGINIFCSRGDLRAYTCTGSKFCVKAHHTEQNGWTVSVANVRECDEFGPAAQQVAIEDAMIKSADPLPIWAGQQWQGSVDLDDDEGGEEDVENGTEEGTEGTAD